MCIQFFLLPKERAVCAFPGQRQEGKWCSTFQSLQSPPKYGDVILQAPRCNALLHRMKSLRHINTSLPSQTPTRNPKQTIEYIFQWPKDGNVSERYTYLCMVLASLVLLMVKNQLSSDSALRQQGNKQKGSTPFRYKVTHKNHRNQLQKLLMCSGYSSRLASQSYV